ncbi:MAG: aminoglycoside 3'-phosphotransferase [Treponemataceae bacterium]|nr:aminoglycoside 3'-phosphotransferase [Treponemataceae bacterium]
MNTAARKLPSRIEAIVGSKPYTLNGVGMSGSEVRMYDDYVLKIQQQSAETDNEYAMVTWLAGKLPVPQIPAYCVEQGTAYTLMTKATGTMLCDNTYLTQPEKLIQMVADGLRQLWTVDVTTCPCASSRLTQRLQNLDYRVSHNLVDVENTEPETFGPGGFKNPEELLRWLKDNRPAEDIVLTHGDFCLPNLFATGDSITSYIDLGKMGPADRWQDVAIAIRSLHHNFTGYYTDGKVLYNFEPHMLTDALGISFDPVKYRYYLLLDELC